MKRDYIAPSCTMIIVAPESIMCLSDQDYDGLVLGRGRDITVEEEEIVGE